MSITFGGASTEGTKEKTNISVNNVTIESATVVYNKQQKWQRKPDDVGIEMKLKPDNVDFTTDYYIGGLFKAPDGLVQGWGSAYKVKLLLEAIGLTGARLDKNTGPEGQRFPTDMHEHLKGKRFALLRYKSTKEKQNGDYYWSDWQTVAAENNFEELRLHLRKL